MSINNNSQIMKIMGVSAIVAVTVAFLFNIATAEPAGATITTFQNTSKPSAPGSIVNSSINGSISPGGYIFTISLDGRQQTMRWKGYVGNVTGTFELDDADGYTMYEWPITNVNGEVYATRSAGTINWSNINCTWVSEGVANAAAAKRTVEEHENHNLSHTNGDDNITATFASSYHPQMVVGVSIIPQDVCFALQTWQNDNEQVFSASSEANFTQVLLWDGSTTGQGSLIYATNIEHDKTGFNPSYTYDFQMLLPENGSLGFSSSTAYYFFVELS